MAEAVSGDSDLLSSYIPMDGLRAHTRSQLARKAEIRQAAQGDYLFRVGEPASQAIYVVNGSVSLEDSAGSQRAEITGGTPASFHRLTRESPLSVSARCLTPVSYLSIDAGLLDVWVTWDQSGAYEAEAGDPASKSDRDADDWMTKLLQMPIFQSVPATNLQAMFMRMTEIKVDREQVIIRQGDEGDYFYVVIDGRCLVTREHPRQKPLHLAELDVGSCFGEEALLSDSERSATITMLTHGRLMRLAKDDFRRFLKEPLMRRLPMSKAEMMISSGSARWLDVRLPSEFQAHHLPGSLNIPLMMLRSRIPILDRSLSYVVCCDTGRRSSVGIFILTQKGLDAYVLEKGIPPK
jgi:CRP-like cAMP-binding protein